MNEPLHRHGVGGGPGRDEIKKAVLELMQLDRADVVADLGAGEGFYAEEFARLVGKVSAVDADAGALASPALAWPSIVTLQKDLCDGFTMPADVTHVFFSNSFHDVDCREVLLNEIAVTLDAGAESAKA